MGIECDAPQLDRVTTRHPFDPLCRFVSGGPRSGRYTRKSSDAAPAFIPGNIDPLVLDFLWLTERHDLVKPVDELRRRRCPEEAGRIEDQL